MGPAGPAGSGGGGGGLTFFVTGVTAGISKWYTGPNSFFSFYNSTSSGEEPMRGAPMTAACNLSKIVMYASTNKRGIADTTDTITLTIFKNNNATAMTCSATSTTNVHEVMSYTCTPSPVAFAIGDMLGLQWTHSNNSFSLFTQYGAGLQCQ